ncbi:MAG: hypothetical protein QNL04_03945 [SAR324 cluster bacterium]|nr:hypothetical protein [SAR324 cluster bacterium]
MSLIIELSETQVKINSYQLTFDFVAPAEKLTHAALETFKMLKASPRLQQNTDEGQRREALQLLQAYGLALFNALIPNSLKSKLHDHNGIVIHTSNSVLRELPFELLFDGVSFLGLTIGVMRGFDGAPQQRASNANQFSDALKVNLFSYTPLGEGGSKEEKLGSGFITKIEELPIPFENDNKISFDVNGQATRQKILQSLARNPGIFFFSGYDSAGGWLLYGLETTSKQPGPGLRESFNTAAANGLRMLMVNTSSLITSNAGAKKYFSFGVPLLLTQGGRVDRSRSQSYFKELTQNLLKENYILKAHRHALNHLKSEMPLSWDWSFLQLNINLHNVNQTPDPLRPFYFSGMPLKKEGNLNNNILCHSDFYGSQEVLTELTHKLLTAPQGKVTNLKSLEGQAIEDQLFEFLRRITSGQNFYLKIIYYQRWGYHEGQEKNLNQSHFSGKLNSLFEKKRVQEFFDDSLITLKEGVDRGLQYLTVYYPPDKVDPAFEDWLAQKQGQGWQIIFLSHNNLVTNLPTDVISTDQITLAEINEALEQEIPEIWEEHLQGSIPPQMRSLPLLQVIARINDPLLYHKAATEIELKSLYEAAFAKLFSILPQKAEALLVILFLMRVQLTKNALARLLKLDDITATLGILMGLRLIESNLDQTRFWLPSHFVTKIQQFQLIAPDLILAHGKELLKNLIEHFEKNQGEVEFIRVGFGYALSSLSQLGLLEGVILRNFQFAKRMAAALPNQPNLTCQSVITGLELSFLTDDEELKEKCLLSTLNILELLPQSYNPLELLEWFLEEAQNNRNWLMVVEIQTKIASLYALQNKKPKAIAYLTSALQLSNDLEHYEDRYQNLISIALLFLELEELGKVKGVLEAADFDPALLTKKQMAFLWLIDGHMSLLDHQPAQAESSLMRFLEFPNVSLPKALEAKAYQSLSLLQPKGSPVQIEQLEIAASYFSEGGNDSGSANCREKLSIIYLDMQKIVEAVTHLEWLFHYHKLQNNHGETSRIAHKLGGLFFKLENKVKSTEYYKLAQGIQV